MFIFSKAIPKLFLYRITYKPQFTLSIYLMLLCLYRRLKFPRSLLVARHYDACLIVRCLSRISVYDIHHLWLPNYPRSDEFAFFWECLYAQKQSPSCYYIESIINLSLHFRLLNASLSIYRSFKFPRSLLGARHYDACLIVYWLSRISVDDISSPLTST